MERQCICRGGGLDRPCVLSRFMFSSLKRCELNCSPPLSWHIFQSDDNTRRRVVATSLPASAIDFGFARMWHSMHTTIRKRTEVVLEFDNES